MKIKLVGVLPLGQLWGCQIWRQSAPIYKLEKGHHEGKCGSHRAAIGRHVFFLSNLGLINISLAELLKTWWPLILIAVAVSLFFTNKGEKK